MSASERRAQLIRVGRKVFAKGGYDATSVEEIAKAARVSKPVVYEHFGGKEGLYAVVVDREMEHVIAQISQAIAEGSPRERAEQGVVAFLTYVRDEPDGFAVLCHDAPTAISGGQLSSLLSIVAERVSDVFVESFKNAGYDPKYAPVYAQALIGMVTFVGRWWVENPSLKVDRVASHLTALAWMGLRHLPTKPDRVDVPRKR
ncbi:MAG: TetR/AcrR family transcriptional regulator [Myxococcota bacterium]